MFCKRCKEKLKHSFELLAPFNGLCGNCGPGSLLWQKEHPEDSVNSREVMTIDGAVRGTSQPASSIVEIIDPGVPQSEPYEVRREAAAKAMTRRLPVQAHVAEAHRAQSPNVAPHHTRVEAAEPGERSHVHQSVAVTPGNPGNGVNQVLEELERESTHGRQNESESEG